MGNLDSGGGTCVLHCRLQPNEMEGSFNMTIPVALQLYSLREDAAKDFPGVLKAVAEMGYEGVEFAGYGGLSASELKKMLGDLGLKVAGSHVGFNLLNEDLDQVIDYNLEIGNKYIICPAAPRELIQDAEGWKTFAQRLSEIGAKVQERGLQLGYHNHSFEFVQFDGKYALDIFFENADPKTVFAELDLGWVFHGGVDPAQYLEKYADRCRLVHIKDFKKDGPQTEVGTGDVDLAAIVKTAVEANVEWYIIETEEYNMDPKDSVKLGLDNLKAVIEGK